MRMIKKENESAVTGMEIAVIGMVGRFPGAANVHEFWENIKNGVESVEFFTDPELEEAGVEPGLLENPNYVKAKGGVLKDKDLFDASFFGYTPREAELMEPQVRVFHEAAWQALEDAGYDPDTYDGLIGLYGGASANSFWEIFSALSGSWNQMGGFASSLLAKKDLMNSRVSYALNLKGPAFSLNTACSTSLVAVHLACRALLTGECNMALAGGVTVVPAQKQGYFYQEGMIASPDGHCRAFDAEARGTVGGEGIGIVVLKRLKNAIADNDHIHAIIKGSAINNDGRRKVGYEAPSVEGQAEVIRRAQRTARVEPTSISYVEAHGTGTILGDPVEIEALKLAFNTGKRQFCALGSVKANIGHLDAAAGVTGLIKTILALKHRAIPPSANFETPNPKIDFENSPFFVNARLTPWNGNSSPLRAGVSSFGIGGTNAHVVVEEAPEFSGDSNRTHLREKELILLSAKTKTALEKAVENLSLFFRQNQDIQLADAAYTLQVGRRAFPYRRMVLCSTPGEAAEALSTTGDKAGKIYRAEENRPVIFMFSGLGAQYADMGLDLYRSEPAFREEMDRCFNILDSLLDYDPRQILFPSETGEPQEPGAAGEIHQIEHSQVLVFILEYSLARLLIKWGLKPEAMIGYSFGEYTAACVSGVFSLEDALKLVVSRGKLITSMPAGTMSSVPLTREELEPLLASAPELSFAIDNGPSCIVAGPTGAVEAFEKQLKNKKILCMRVQASHALHSQMMAPILDEFEKIVAAVPLNPPQIPYISNRTGTWVTPEQAVDPRCWAEHLGRTVQFADGIRELVKTKNAVFIEIGPGRDLTTLIRRYFEDQSGQQSINLIRQPQKNVSDISFLQDRIGRLWLWGVKIDWYKFNHTGKRYRIPLPTYPFNRKPFAIADNFYSLDASGAEETRPARKTDMADWFYIPSWERAFAIPAPQDVCSRLLVFSDDDGLASRILETMTADGQLQSGQSVIVKIGQQFDRQGDTYTINPRESGDYDSLFRELLETDRLPDKIIHSWNVPCNPTGGGDADEQDRYLDTGLFSLLYIAQSIGNQGITQKIQIDVITGNMQEVQGGDGKYPGKSAVLGAVKIIPMEYSNISSRNIDIIPPVPGSPQEIELIHHLSNEFAAKHPRIDYSNISVAYRGRYRWVQSIKPHPLDTPANAKLHLKEKGIYLIIGGFGGMGFTVAGYLAETVKARLILVGRSPFPAEDEWDEWLDTHDENDEVSRKIHRLRELKEMGSEIIFFSADVSDSEDMREIIRQAQDRFGQLNGVIHAAGVIDYAGVIQRRTREMTEDTMRSKVKGTWVLHNLLKDVKLDFLVLFSSLGNVLYGNKFGQVGYNAANEFFDAYTHYKASLDGTPTITVNWADWKEVGIAVKSVKQFSKDVSDIDYDTLFHEALSPAEGAGVFSRIMGSRLPRVVISTIPLQKEMERVNRPEDIHSRASDVLQDSSDPAVIHERPDLDTPYEAPRDETQQMLADIFQQFLGIDKVGIHDDFFELGGDSLKALILLPRVHKESGVEIPIGDFFSKPTIEGLAGMVLDKTGGSTFSAIEPAADKPYYSLTSAQKRLYILQQLEKDKINYNQTNAVFLEGRLETPQLEQAFHKLIERHESFRTSFEMIDGEPVQKIHKNVPFDIQYREIDDNDSSIEEPVNEFIKPFDLSQPPLLRALVIKQAASKHILVVDMHHIIADGFSLELFFQDFIPLYNRQELPPLKIQYRDYSEWKNKEDREESLKKQETFWLKEFAGEIPILTLPTDYPRPPIQAYEGSQVGFHITAEQVEKLKQLASEQKATLFMVLLAIYYIFLARISGQEDIVVGTPTAGRGYPELQKLIGMFVNTLPLRNYPAGDKSFSQFLEELRVNTLQALEHQGYPFEDIVEKSAVKRDAGRQPIFDVMFVLQNMERKELEIPGLKLKPRSNVIQTSKFDFTLEASEQGDRLYLTFEYSTHLFRPETIDRFIGYIKKAVSSILEDPQQRISDIEIIPHEEKQRLLFDFNNTAVQYPDTKTIHQLFTQQAAATPQNTAIAGTRHAAPSTSDSITYSRLDEESNHIAGVLQEKGVVTGAIVGIMMNRSIDMIAAIFGILKAGGAYLPIDPQYPVERIRYMLSESAASVLITTSDLSESVPFEKEIVYIDRLTAPGPGISQPLAHDSQSAHNLAYVIYTSGSTGKPKGVAITHRNVINFITGITRRIEFSTGRSILALTTISFDIFVLETLLPLVNGLRIVIASEEQQKDSQQLADLVVKENVQMVQMTPSSLKMLLDVTAGVSCLENVSVLMVGGESFPQDLFLRLKEHYKGQIYNMYGPTETTVWSSVRDLTHTREIDIGTPIANTGIYIVDTYNRLVPVGVVGELCIGGDGLARGYLNRQELSIERFVVHPFGENGECPRFYRTGDLARWLPDGNIELLGRTDFQVKIRGFRIELGEIESKLLKHPAVKEVVVLAKDIHLYAYVVSSEELFVSQLKEYLSGQLPDYMIPSHFLRIEKIPLTPNRKVDRKALESHGTGMGTGVEFVAPRNEIEEQIARVWMEILNLDKVGVQDNFFDLGGTSLDMIKINVAFKELFNEDNTVIQMFRYTTISSYARYLEQKRNGSGTPGEESKRTVQVDKIKKRRASQKNKRRGK